MIIVALTVKLFHVGSIEKKKKKEKKIESSAETDGPISKTDVCKI